MSSAASASPGEGTDRLESVFTYGAPGLKFGTGASDEIGYDLAQYDVRRVLVLTDPGVAATGHPQRIADQMGAFGIEARIFDGVRVEPTDASFEAAIAFARDTGPWDAYVAVGGGCGHRVLGDRCGLRLLRRGRLGRARHERGLLRRRR